MQRKTIEKVINQKFEQWVNSIKDDKVKLLVKKNTIITGGCIPSMFLNEDVNDFDVYFTDRKTVILVADYYIKLFNKRKNGKNASLVTGELLNEKLDKNKQHYDGKDAQIVTDESEPDELYEDEKDDFENLRGISSELDSLIHKMKSKKVNPLQNYGSQDEVRIVKSFDIEEQIKYESGPVKIFIRSDGEAREQNPTKEKFRPTYLTDNSITLSDDIQIIIRFWGDAKGIHKNFDYVHCTNYWLSITRKLYTNVEALECILSKTLMYKGSKYPLCSIIRSRKFITRGWKINAGQYLKMVMQLNEMDLTNINVLREQLIGVDVAYFRMFIEAMEAKMKLESLYGNATNPENGLETDFIMELVDRIFDGDQEAEKNEEDDDS